MAGILAGLILPFKTVQRFHTMAVSRILEGAHHSANACSARVDLSKLIHTQLPSVLRLAVTTLIPLILLAYALLPLRPLFSNPDDLPDVPLTPQQRSLLGLKPSSQPATPGSRYITPPRYSRSATPRSGSSSASGSPFSGKGSPLGSGMAAPSYSPNASLLFQKAMGRDSNRRFSYASPSPLGRGKPAMESSSSLASQLTDSPSAGKGASVGLNSRWLYERGRRSSSGLRTGFA